MISILVEMEVMVAGRNECCFMRGMGEEGGMHIIATLEIVVLVDQQRLLF